ncbi:hypothetical protein [Candidatus Contendibacter odensensis]|uniref:Uncharacterized protein n=1 Tax=Candidatus Contendobacter odensis Run_B_J11 TaxID=1400861 RepID=A0A7U7J252_9GAMM|nr:hypothetical protein [Candidatus Contendobacter odensis]CDH44668.1 conserved hypothetical protein [Candidatus Contendobacter odensis Run_B_J11]
MNTLWPPLALLETELFSPSDALIERWRSGVKLPADMQRALDADPESHARRSALETALSTDPAIAEAAPIPPVPPDLRALIRQRVASRQATFSRLPTPGQIVRIDEVRGPNGLLHWDLPRPLTVLLVESTATRQVWYGWLVMAESDYAGYWDLLLGSEDEPCDPLARMVQLWNPVHVYLPSVSRVLAQLTPNRLVAVRALAVDCATASEPDPAPAQPGRIVRRQVAGHWLHTGTPLGGPDDPRHAYQRLCHAYAAAVREPARLAHAQPTLAERLLSLLRKASEACSLALTTAPAPVMGEATTEIYRLGDWLELELHESPDEVGILTLRIRNLQATPCRVQIVRQGEVRRESVLEPHQDARILVEAAPSTELVLLDENGERLRWPLAE